MRPLGAGTDPTEMEQVNEDWKVYIQRKIDAWKRTLEWSSPSDKDDVSGLIGTFTGSDSVIGEHVASNMQDFADEFHRDLSSKKGPAFELVEACKGGRGFRTSRKLCCRYQPRRSRGIWSINQWYWSIYSRSILVCGTSVTIHRR